MSAIDPPFRASRYTTGAIVLHWTIALLIAAQIAGGYAMVEFLETGSALQFQIYQLHKSIGITVLVLTIARIVWRIFNPPPPEPASVSTLERRASHAVHMAFYGLLIAIPLSGWLMITVSPVQVETVLFFADWLPWPHLPGLAGLSDASREALTHWSEIVHAWLAYGAGLLVALHVAGAMKHQLQDGAFIGRILGTAAGDGARNSYGHVTTLLVTALFAGAMIGAAGYARAPEAEAVAASAAETAISPDQPAVLAQEAALGVEPADVGARPPSASSTSAAGSQDGASADGGEAVSPAVWSVDHDASAVRFTLTSGGNEIVGGFEGFDANIVFDPAALERSTIAVTIDTASATIDSADISVRQLVGSDGFASEEFPTATYEAETIRTEGDGYVADGVLTIRGTSLDQPLPFTLQIEGDRARAQGSLTLDRLAYAVGERNDAQGEFIGTDVTVDVTIEASRVAAEGTQSVAAQGETAAADGSGDAPPLWSVRPDESGVSLSFVVDGSQTTGRIPDFDAAIAFDAQNLDASSIAVTLDLTTASPNDLRGSDGLSVSDYPTARFESERIRREGDGFVADGTLTIHETAQPVALPFTLTMDGDRGTAEGAVTINRRDFGVGPAGSMVDDAVEVAITVVADRPQPGAAEAADAQNTD